MLRKIAFLFLTASVVILGLYITVIVSSRNDLRGRITDLAAAEATLAANTVAGKLSQAQQGIAEFVIDEDLEDMSLAPERMEPYDLVYLFYDIYRDLSRVGMGNSYVRRIRCFLPLAGKVIIRGEPDLRISDITPEAYLAELRTLQDEDVPFAVADSGPVINVLPTHQYGLIGGTTAPYFWIRVDIDGRAISRDLDHLLARQNGSYALYATNAPDLVVASSGDWSPQRDNRLSLEVVQQLNGFSLSLAYRVPFAELGFPLFKYQVWVFVVSVLSIALLLALTSIMRNLVVRPVLTLAESFRRIEGGDLAVRLDSHQHDEFDYLYSAFNSMTSKLQDLIHRVYEQNLRLQQQELKQLQYQINPHFLYNSLYLVYRMARFSDLEGVTQMTQHLSKYYEYLTRSGRESVPLRDELAHVANYLGIQVGRFDGLLEASVGEPPDAIADMLVPRLILQPIVENAYVHGVRATQAGNRIRVTCAVTARTVQITVEDDGSMTSDDTISGMNAALAAGDGRTVEMSGMQNVHRRLRITFGDRGGVAVTRSELGGAMVTVTMGREGLCTP